MTVSSISWRTRGTVVSRANQPVRTASYLAPPRFAAPPPRRALPRPDPPVVCPDFGLDRLSDQLSWDSKPSHVFVWKIEIKDNGGNFKYTMVGHYWMNLKTSRHNNNIGFVNIHLNESFAQ